MYQQADAAVDYWAIALASLAMGHWGTWPLDLQQFIFFSALWPIQSLTATICRQLPPVKTQ